MHDKQYILNILIVKISNQSNQMIMSSLTFHRCHNVVWYRMASSTAEHYSPTTQKETVTVGSRMI